MTRVRTCFAFMSIANALAAICIFTAFGARATPLELVYTGAFTSQEALNRASSSSPVFFVASTPFTIHARFDDSSANLAPSFGGPFNGFRAYAPSTVTIDIAGVRYTVENIISNPTAGVTVAIFDRNSFTPGRYGVGLFADPVGDGAGIVGDFASASPNFVASALTPTVFTDYFGAGHSSGVCLSGSAPACPHAVTPWVLHDSSNAAWNLTFGNFIEDYPVEHSPGVQLGPLNTAQILAVPEPSTQLLAFAALAGLGFLRKRDVRRSVGRTTY